jgi:hypothetical protein
MHGYEAHDKYKMIKSRKADILQFKNLYSFFYFPKHKTGWKNNIKMDLRKIGLRMRDGWNWLRILFTGERWN